MAEDIDQLLDEFESKFIAESSNKSKKISLQKSTSKSRSYDDNDIQAAMADIFSISDPVARKEHPPLSQQNSGKQCFPSLLTGAPTALAKNAVNLKACDNLRCTNCDFKVCAFNNFEWSSKTDYLFLRNNVPEVDRLKINLVPKTGSRAYACQCQWRSVCKPIDLKTDIALKWVCGRH